ncbi:hypothetical protein AAG570_013380 [Ranatra chinensis]|uniref:C2H2-type domain-containing protein n=1 Tax=Ranatra chinensis TaxID=642074 RepID=A0ABD0YC13_9HEMI
MHEQWECGKQPKFQCNICEQKFYLEKYLRQHVTEHSTKVTKNQKLDIVCDSCGKKFKHLHNLEIHQKYLCGVESKFECEICSIKFSFKAHLNEHLLNFHTEASVQNPPLPAAEIGFEELKYRCELCPRAFTRVGSLNYHVSRKHSGKPHQTERDPSMYPFVCSACGNSYKNSTQLCRHRKWECGKEPMFQCTQCVKKFHHRHGLKQHIRLHLAKNSKQIPSMEFCCDKCGKGYKLKSSLNNHTKWECGKEPVFACTMCFVKFNHKGNLKKHILTKHINKP